MTWKTTGAPDWLRKRMKAKGWTDEQINLTHLINLAKFNGMEDTPQCSVREYVSKMINEVGYEKTLEFLQPGEIAS